MYKKLLAGGFVLASLLLVGCKETGGDSVEVQATVTDEIQQVAEKPKKGIDYRIVPEKSVLKWRAGKTSLTYHGEVSILKGQVFVNDGNVESGSVKIDMTSITNEDIENDERNEKFLIHMKSPEFFNVKNHPSATFQISEVKKNGEKYEVTGNLTLRGMTKSLTFPADIEFGDKEVRARAKFGLDRTQWGIIYASGKFIQADSDSLIDDLFQIELDIVAEPA